MEDRYGRKIEYMRVSVTDRCNLRCKYCMPENGISCVSHTDILTYDEIERICRIGAGMGISKIKLTGGEPLVRKNLSALVGMLKKIPGIQQVTVTTNGILLKEQIDGIVSAGIDAINISMDTLDPEGYREVTRGGQIKDVLSGLDAACSFPGLRVKVNCVPLKESVDDEYVRMAGLARERDISVRFIELMPIGLGKKFHGRTGEEILGILKKTYGVPKPYKGKLGNGPAVYVQFPGFRGKIGFISAVSHQFCHTCNRIRLTSEGMLKPCLHYGGGTDLRILLRKGADDGELEKVMRDAVSGKPECHHFRELYEKELHGDGTEPDHDVEQKEMFRIGG